MKEVDNQNKKISSLISSKKQDIKKLLSIIKKEKIELDFDEEVINGLDKFETLNDLFAIEKIIKDLQQVDNKNISKNKISIDPKYYEIEKNLEEAKNGK
ncbi:hypothetical protein [Metamycoplasma gateae]|uniref:Uncharacterized protein n=1 Tax=Metamycoplasma gateae TaxID=35769 RepID=A0ABZ2AI71_9BACT|nr:hypothetical protein V2E26_01180 [Metamycoplasma gateae]